MTICSLEVLLFLFGTSLLFHVQFELLLPDLLIWPHFCTYMHIQRSLVSLHLLIRALVLWDEHPTLMISSNHNYLLRTLSPNTVKLWVRASVQYSHSVVSDSLQPHEPQHARHPCPSPIPGAHPNPCPLSRWCHPTISSSVVPFSSCSQSFPASGSFQMSQLAKVLEFQLQHQSFQWTHRTDLFSDELVGSPCSPRDSQESSPTTQFKSITSSVLSFLYSPNSQSIHDHWKTHSLD